MVRGEVFRLPAPRGTRGHEQSGARYAVVVQADEFLHLSTTIVAPTLSASVRWQDDWTPARCERSTTRSLYS
jgi:mRNA-degrading endonuclease toxin of MazEF toxin-antitoxin module